MKAQVLSSIALFGVLVVLGLGVTGCSGIVCDPEPGTPVNAPMGTAKGINPGRVVWNFRPDATTWDGKLSSNWWSDEFTNPTIVTQMLEETMMSLSGGKTVDESWDKVFHYFNKAHNISDKGYTAGEKIAIKINLNGDLLGYGDNNGNELSPQFLKALISQLVAHGVPQEDIAIYDASRLMEPHFADNNTGLWPEFENVILVDNQGGYPGRQKVEKDDTDDHIMFFSNSEVPDNNDTRLPTIVTAASYLIEIDNFRGHVIAGITESGKNFFGSIYRPTTNCTAIPGTAGPGPWCPLTLHDFVNVTDRPMGSYTPLVDLLGHPKLAGNGLIFFSDGLYGGPTQSNDEPTYYQVPVPFESEPFNGHWSSSIFASQDVMALDSVLFDFLRNEPTVPFAKEGCVDNYLHEGAKADDPPSKTAYNPSGVEGVVLESLGVHEHWNDAKNKQYSRNLGTGDGIELIQIVPGGSSSSPGAPGSKSSTDYKLWYIIGGSVGGAILLVVIVIVVIIIVVVLIVLAVMKLVMGKKGGDAESTTSYRPVNPADDEADYLLP